MQASSAILCSVSPPPAITHPLLFAKNPWKHETWPYASHTPPETWTLQVREEVAVALKTTRRLSVHKLHTAKWHCLWVPPPHATPTLKHSSVLPWASISWPFSFPFPLTNLPSYKFSPAQDMWVVGTVVIHFLVSVGHLSRDNSPTELTSPTFPMSRDHFSNVPPLRCRSNKPLAWGVTPRTKTVRRYRIHTRNQKRQAASESQASL